MSRNARSVELVQTLHRQGELTLARGWRVVDRLPVLVLTSDGPPTSVETRLQLAREFAQRDVLDAQWAAKPIELIDEAGVPALLLTDPGGDLLGRHVGRPWETGAFLQLALGLCDALGSVHARGLIHRDVKPSNILFSLQSRRCCLTGFAMASHASPAKRGGGRPATIAGTWAYMAPEQTGHMNRPVDERSDLYSLGIVFYELLTGARPFSASDPFEWIHSHVARAAVPPQELQPAVPAVLSSIVMKLLAKSSEERYQTAHGVASDLRRCMADWEERRVLSSFPIGAHDRPHRVKLPGRIHGRQREIATLTQHVERVVSQGRSEMVLVSGYSGVGKSSVVNELRDIIVEHGGAFISGKFEPALKDTPYATIADAFQGLIARILTESPASVERWRDAVLEAVGATGALLLELIPRLQALIGPQPPVVSVPAREATARFQLAFLRFVGVFARPDHPLVLFLDDLQWLDPGTLSLVECLAAHPDLRHLLLVGAYRDNEVGPDQPLMRMLAALRANGCTIEDIILEPLSVDDLIHLVGDALQAESASVHELAAVVHQKTGGNPCFAGQFLANLEEERLLRYDPGPASWSFDTASIAVKDFTDNVVDLVCRRLGRLPTATQRALKIFACLGSHADRETLNGVLASDRLMHASLFAAAAAGVVIAEQGRYRFCHDRVHEAAYALIPERARPREHLRVARWMWRSLSARAVAERIFDVAHQVNMALPLLSSRTERTWAAEINLQAGRKAKASTAYASACHYLVAASGALADEGWDSGYELAFAVCMELAECELCRSNLEDAARHTEVLLQRGRIGLDRAQALGLRMTLQLMQSDVERAVITALEALDLLGHRFPAHPTEQEMQSEYDAMWRTLGHRTIESLAELPLLTDPETRVAMGIMTRLGLTSYYTDQNLYQTLVFRLVKLTMLHGHCEWSPLAYGGLAICLGPAFQRFSDAEEFIRLSFAIAQRHGFAAQLASLHTLRQQTILWTRPIAEAITCLETGLEVALAAGDLVFACYSREHRLTNLVTAGRLLDEVWNESVASLEFVRKSRFNHVAETISSLRAFVQALRGRQANESVVDERALEATIRSAGIPIVLCWHLVLQVQRHYVLEQPEVALELCIEVDAILWSTRYHIQSATFAFYQGLVAASMCDRVPPPRRAALMASLDANIVLLDGWARSCPSTFAHKLLLLQAEAARLGGHHMEALRLYEAAVRHAGDEGFVQEEAIANELAARQCRERGLASMAAGYMFEAKAAYARWGARVKVDLLESGAATSDVRPSGQPLATIEEPLGPAEPDLSRIVEISQSLAGELAMGKLVGKLLTVAVKHASASRGVLITQTSEGPLVEAEARTGTEELVAVEMLGRAPTSSDLPVGVLQKVMRTRKSVIIDDSLASVAHSRDDYFRHAPVRSVVCLPLVTQGQLMGVLFLESDARTAFAPPRYAALQLLSSQVANCLQNASLYVRLERENVERRQAEAALRQSRKRYALAMEAAADGHAEWIADTGEFYASPRLLEQWGLPAAHGHCRFVRMQDAFPLHPDDRPRISDLLERSLADETLRVEFDARILRNGEVRWMHTNVLFVRDGSGKLTRIVSASTEITARMQAESGLRTSEERYALALAASDESAFDWDLGSQRLYFAPRTQELLGLIPGEVWRSREEWQQLVRIHPDDFARKQATVDAHIAGLTPMLDIEVRILQREGIRWLHKRGTALRDREGRAYRVVGSISDITEHKHQQEEMARLESRLQQAERFEAMGTLAGGIAHDFNNLLGAILGFGERALRSAREGSRLHRDLSNVVVAGERGRTLVDRILSFSRGTAGDRVAVHVEKVVREALNLLRAKLPVHIELRSGLRAGRAAVLGDAMQIRQLLMNLGTNAVHAMTQAGALTVSLETAELVQERQAKVGAVPAGTWVLLKVADQGTGMTPEILEHIFDPFFTTKEVGVGTGLGLSLVLRIVTQAGGAIDVQSTPGAGSVFTVYLPCAGEAPEEPSDARPAAPPPRGSGQRVMVVDDEESLLELTTDALRELGYEPMGYGSAHAALEAFGSNPDDFDVLITDLRMPGMSGDALIREVRQLRPLLPVILVRAYVGDAASANSGWADEVLDKPLRIDCLAVSLARVLS